MKPLHITLGVSGLLVLAATAFSGSTGSLPGTLTTNGQTVNHEVARVTGCGQCHTGPTPSTVVVHVNPAARTFPKNATIAVNTTLTGGISGPPPFDNWGGFINEVTAGTFTPSPGTKVDPNKQFITHTFAFLGRSWNYNYTATSTAGMVELYAAGNTVNADGTEMGDQWGFHGDPSGQVSVPVRLYANENGNVHHGDGCVGSFGNYPVLGSKEVPAIGNQSFGYEVWGAPVSAPGVMFVGSNPNFSADLSVIGINGCTLHVQPVVNISTITSAGGSSMRGDGMATIAFPLPNLPILQGATLQMQVALIDVAVTGRSIALTLTNAIATTIQ